MTSTSDQVTHGELSPLKRALIALDQMQAKLDAAENARREPIAIVGMACRFPGGADDPDSFWRLLVDGREAISEVPADRWNIDAVYDPDPDAPGKMSTRSAGFLGDVTGFDPQFFGIAPREATSIDPQQRLLLEVAWEALENAGIAPDRLGGSRTGVFIGMTTSDYSTVQLDANGLAGLDSYYASGAAHSIASGRLSYVLGLRGPSITLDTACSSSLVAVHLAVQNLRAGESRLALAGGVNLILSPENSIMLSKFRMMSPDGRCKAFDAAADGFGRGEGCGIVALKRLSDAKADGDRILAVIRGSAANQDGASSGLTAPNGPSQEAVVRDALANAGVASLDVGYVEAHGTGTALGDPIEVQALAAALCGGRATEAPLAIGSVKTNIGHLEAAAGVAGLIKAVLVLQHGEIPPHLLLHEPNPHIDWASMPIVVPTELTRWAADRPRIAGVSAFGFSGTNVHVVLEAAPAVEPAPVDERLVHVLTLSARTEPALRELARRYVAHLAAHPELSLTDVCATANAGRARLAHRLAISAVDLDELCGRLEAVAAGESVAGVTAREASTGDPLRVAFLFTGQGSQSAGMAAGLYRREPVFRSALDRVVDLFDAELLLASGGLSLTQVLHAAPGSADAAQLDQTMFTQASLFAVELALVDLWRSWGVVPSGLLGHSLGEIVAAVVAGVLSVEDGVRLVAARGRLMQALPVGGSMLAVYAPAADVSAAVAASAAAGAVLAVAAVNGPAHTVVSGAAADVSALGEAFALRGVRVKALAVSHAFHSPLMQPMIDDFRSIAASLTYHPPRMRVVSNLTGAVIGRELTDPEYWVRHVLAPVQFAAGVATLAEMGFDTFVEIGPHPVLSAMGQECVAPGTGTWVPSLRRTHADDHMVVSVASLHLAGADIDWRQVEAPHGARRVALPTSPFERQRFWVQRGRRSAVPSTSDHPLLGRRLPSPLATVTFQSEISTETLAILGDHRVFGTAILPATAFLEIALAAGRTFFPDSELDDVVIHEALVALDEGIITVQTILTPDASGVSFRIYSQVEGADRWATHVSGRIIAAGVHAPMPPGESIEAIQRRADRVVEADEHDARMNERGLVFGASLRNLHRVWTAAADAAGAHGGEALGEIALAPREAAESRWYVVHPALLDAAIQVLAGVAASGPDTYLPISVDRVATFVPPGVAAVRAWSHAVLRAGVDLAARPETIAADVMLLDPAGAVLAVVEGLRLKRADQVALLRLSRRDRTSEWLYEVAWRPVGAKRPAAEGFPPAHQLAAAAAGAVGRLRDEHQIPRYQGLLDELEALSTDYIVVALERLGVRFEPGVAFDAGALPVADQHRRLLAHLLDMLADDGIIEPSPKGWSVVRGHVADIDPTRIAELLESYPAGEGELTITRRCGEQLAEALTGAADPLQLLFPGGSLDSAEQMYQLSPFAQFYNSLAAEAVAAAVADLASGSRLRVLEIGAGTGGTSAYVLPVLPADRVERYTYTDVSPHFLGRARQKFVQYPFADYRVLDIEGDLAAQGFDGQQFDIVVAANVLHATADLRHTFANVAGLLAPNGMLVMTEMVQTQRFISISFGLTDGWWKFTDTDLRPHGLLLSGAEWQRFLGENGFVDAQVVPSPTADGPSALSIQSIIVAQRAATHDEAVPLPGADLRWLILADPSAGVGLAQLVADRGGHPVVVTPGATFRHVSDDRYEVNPASAEDFERLVAATGVGRLGHVVHLWGLNEARGASARERAVGPLGSALHLTRALASQGAAVRLCWVTRGGQPAGGVAPEPEAALLWGFAKTVALEHPELQPMCLDLDPCTHPGEAEELLSTILDAGAEDQLALRGGARLAARLVVPPRRASSEPYELTFTARGTLDNLMVRPLERRPPAAGEVEIRVHATGLNFKDVLNVLGMYPGDPGPLGGECAGTIVAVGEGVEGLHAGDRVVALASGAFRSHTTCEAAFVAPLPASLSFADGAGLLIAHVTAEFALRHLGRLQAGERVLIHAAAGGVGLAAVALAQRVGAEVYATAGSEAKRDHLRSLGVRHVYDSRSLTFAGQIMADTGAEGVDVVLNSLAGEFVPASLGLLRDNGRFLEIGKRDHLAAERVAELGHEVAYHVIDWSESTRTEPQLIRSMIDAVIDDLASGALLPLPVRTFEFADAQGAFRFMAQARHTGKVVVVQPEAATDRATEIRADGTYLVTGGLGGLGLLTAQHLAARGARHLVLLGRRQPGPAALDAIADLRRGGVNVEVCTGDVSVRADVEHVLDIVRAGMPPLRGVFHSAGALDDAALGTMSWEQVTNVLAAKVDGALLLDELTNDAPLDHFVMYASIASLFGSPGQANHAAANAFMDALAHRRAASGRVALSIDWGAWSEIGAAADRGVDKQVAEHGVGVIPPTDGLAILDQLLDGPSPQVGVSPVNWPALLRRYGDGGPPPYFAEVADATEQRPVPARHSAGAVDLAARLAGAAPERRAALLLDVVRDHAAHVLALSVGQVGDRVPLGDLGLDSLMAVDLRNVLGAALGLSRPIPATLVFDYPTVEAIAGFLAAEVAGGIEAAAPGIPSSMTTHGIAPTGRPPADAAMVTNLLDDLESLSDEEIDAQLARRSAP